MLVWVLEGWSGARSALTVWEAAQHLAVSQNEASLRCWLPPVVAPLIVTTIHQPTCTQYLPDFKFWSAESSHRYAKARDYPERAREAIKEMHRQASFVGWLHHDVARS